MRGWKLGVFAGVAATMSAAVVASAKESASGPAIRRGEYLVAVGGCHDCHSPKNMGPNGPAPDMTRALSGHPQNDIVAETAKLTAAPWAYAVTPDLTAWSGPWGVSFAANLTPDAETGLGKWTAENFIEAMRTGRHMGRGRPILPPMPYYNYAKMTDQDLKSVFSYLRTLKPIKNRVPEPIAPESAGMAGTSEAGKKSGGSGGGGQ